MESKSKHKREDLHWKTTTELASGSSSQKIRSELQYKTMDETMYRE